jgi:hypothetical protein
MLGAACAAMEAGCIASCASVTACCSMEGISPAAADLTAAVSARLE